ncbi:MAG: thymidine phosphorylase [Verrucomicrobiales bacterium]
MHVPSLIEKKRDGGVLDADEICYVIREFTAGRLPDYQMSALAMAVFFRGLDAAETAELARAMLESGERFQWPSGHPPVVDKHSTGGIGDKVSLLLAPLLACDGLWVPMISGRGLGITGGTLDKLESIPGFRVRAAREEAQRQVEAIGVVMMGQSAEICPADGKLYALRDVTATVPSRPLIVASIMSKKLAETLDRLVLDVKFGTGAFMGSEEEAKALAEAMIEIGAGLGVQTHARLTPMNEPHGFAVGNALEVQECLDTFAGHGPADLVKLTLDLADPIANSGRATLGGWLVDGTARRKFEQLVAAQGGDLDAFSRLGRAPVVRALHAERSGMVLRMDAGAMGRASVALGAGRSKTDDVVDSRVGFDQIIKVGKTVRCGDVLLRVHALTEAAAESALQGVKQGIEIGD